MDSPRSGPSSPRTTPRACATCKKLAIPYWQISMKNCSRCREQNRKKKQLATERKREREVMLAKARKAMLKMDQERPAAAPTPRPPIPAQKENGLEERAKPVARPSKRPALRDLEGDAQDAVMNQMKNTLQVLAKASKAIEKKTLLNVPHGTSHASPGGKEYQTATALYESLKRRSSNSAVLSRKMAFNGYHTIVAVSTIDHLKRIDMVANDLRKIARLSFDHTKPKHSYDFETMARSVSFQCTCLGNKSPSMDARLMGTSSKISMPKLCGRTVTITAVDDNTHPLNILGQRICVRVEHK